MADWVEVIVPVGAADVDDVAALIALEVPAASAGTEQRGDEVVFWVSPEDAAAALAQARDAASRWQANGAAIDPSRIRIATAMPEAEWRDAWKRYFKVSRLTRQIVVVPSWESYTPSPGDVPIALDPGMAFGTGTHASTQLVLEELQALADGGLRPARVLDMGCGSGILAIAAAKLWPSATLLAIDNDPIAITATAENVAANDVRSSGSPRRCPARPPARPSRSCSRTSRRTCCAPSKASSSRARVRRRRARAIGPVVAAARASRASSSRPGSSAGGRTDATDTQKFEAHYSIELSRDGFVNGDHGVPNRC